MHSKCIILDLEFVVITVETVNSFEVGWEETFVVSLSC